MTEWSVVSVIIVLLGLCATVVSLVGNIKKPIEELTKSVTELSVSMNALKDNFDSNEERNSKSHEEISTRINGNEVILHDHETRISILETTNKNSK